MTAPDRAVKDTGKDTALTEVHRSLGATFTDFAGWNMPVRYGSEVAEHHAVRTRAGLFDLSHMGEIELVGPDSGPALDYALVGRPSRISPGRARYTMICAENGGILDDLVVYRLEDDRYLVVANASNVEDVAHALRERAQEFDTVVSDVSELWSLIAVQGPASAIILDGLVPLDVRRLRYYAIDATDLAGHDVLLARTGYTGEDGFEIYCNVDDAVEIWNTVAATGNPHGLVPAGLACRDTLRLEAGMPLYGNELSRNLTPYDAGLGRVVALNKADGFVGGDALSRRSEEPAERTLIGLVSGGRRSPRSGYPVLDPMTGAAVGTITSGAPSPTIGKPIAMAYVAAEHSVPGTRLQVDVRGSLEDVEVVALPFYARES